MNCTKHFDLSSSLTASCVAKFMMCQLNFSGLVCSVLSLDECLIKITLTLDDFVWLLGSFVTSCDIMFDWYAMLRSAFIELQGRFCLGLG